MLLARLIDDESSCQSVVIPPAAEPFRREDLLLPLDDLAHGVQLQVLCQLKVKQCLTDCMIMDLMDKLTLSSLLLTKLLTKTQLKLTKSFCITVCWKKGRPASCLRTSSTVTSPLPCWPNSGQCL